MLSNLGDLNNYSNGEYFFENPRNFSVCLLNFENISKFSKILVCFNAAISNRDKKEGPFYSGMGIASKIKIPTVCVSDYLITNNKNLSLAWYAGGAGFTNFQNSLALFLDKISRHFGRELILLGGSGGGFASLAISSLLTVKAFVIAMNPQSSISKYYLSAVNRYLEFGFSQFSAENSKEAESFLFKQGIVHNICDFVYKENISIFYLQHKKDKHHVERHLIPFIKNKDLVPYGDNSYMIDNKIGLYLGAWVGRHTPPPTLTIIKLIELINLNFSLDYVLRFLENGADNTLQKNPSVFLLTKYDYKLEVDAVLENLNINLRVKLFYRGSEIDIPNGLLFAVYLIDVDNHIIDRHGYADNIPLIPYLKGGRRVMVFVKDHYGRKLTSLSNTFKCGG